MSENKSAVSAEQLAAALALLPGWEHLGKALSKRYACASFGEITVLMKRLAATIEVTGHHPDAVLCTTTRTITVTTTTHSAGGVTQADLDFAAALEASA